METLVKICIIALPVILAFAVIFPLLVASKPHFEDTDEFISAMNNPDENSYS